MIMEAIKSIEYKGYTIEVVYDNDPQDTREWDRPSTMSTWHSRYRLGDEQPAEDPQEWYKEMSSREDIPVILPLYLYDHSGLSISTGSYGDRWDSGPLGWIWITKESIEKEGWTIEQAQKYMEGEVEEYDQYLRGEVYGYRVLDKEGDEIDSCWGFYDQEDMIEEAKSVVDWQVKEGIKKHLEQLKKWIINKVPLMYRKELAI